MDNFEIMLKRKRENISKDPLNRQKNTIQYRQGNSSYLNSPTLRHFQKYELIVQNQHLQLQMQRVQWRSKTELPILKVLFYKIQQKQLLKECSVLQIAIQNYSFNLSTLPKLTYQQVLYLLREGLVGFWGLFQKFGSFEINSKMVMINKNQKCKVWMNENITVNYPMRRNSCTEGEAINKIILLMEKKCIKITLLIDLFKNMRTVSRFQDALQIIDGYLRTNRIALLTKFPSLLELPSTKYIQGGEDSKEKKTNFGTSTLRKTPKFILQFREDKKQFLSTEKKGKNSHHKLQRNSIYEANRLNKSISPLLKLSYSNKCISPKSGREIKVTRSFKMFPKQKSQCLLVKDSLEQMKATGNIKTAARILQQSIYQKISVQFQNLFLDEHSANAQKSEQKQSPLKVPLLSINSSQQTSASSNSIVMTPLKVKQVPDQVLVLQRNGWQTKFDRLFTQDGLSSQIKQSFHQGAQAYSQEYALTAGKLVYLQNMGKAVKESVLYEQD